MTDCRSSFFLDETRSSSPWTCALMPFGPSSRMIFAIFFASSCVMPSFSAMDSRYSLPDSFGSLASSTLSETPRLTSLSLNTSRTALARSSLLARISTPWSPDQAIDAPTLRKSNRVLISLPAWFSALSTSCRSSLDTMSNEESAGIWLLLGHEALKAGSRLDGILVRGHAETPGGGPWHRGLGSRPAHSPLFFSVPPGARRHPGRLPERPKGAVCKTVGYAFGGSNPPPATSCENGPLAANCRLCGPFCLVPPCVTLCRCRPLCCGVHGHIADGDSGQGAVCVAACWPGSGPRMIRRCSIRRLVPP